jgi:hypothetical protein
MKYEYRNMGTTTTSSGRTHIYVVNLIVVKVPWWKRLWRWAEREKP